MSNIPNQTYQIKHTKSNIPNQTYQIKHTKSNIPETYQIKHTKYTHVYGSYCRGTWNMSNETPTTGRGLRAKIIMTAWISWSQSRIFLVLRSSVGLKLTSEIRTMQMCYNLQLLRQRYSPMPEKSDPKWSSEFKTESWTVQIQGFFSNEPFEKRPMVMI